MTLKSYVNAIVSAGLSGGVAALTQLTFRSFDIDWKHTGTTFAAGALIGVVQHFRAAPGTVSIPSN